MAAILNLIEIVKFQIFLMSFSKAGTRRSHMDPASYSQSSLIMGGMPTQLHQNYLPPHIQPIHRHRNHQPRYDTRCDKENIRDSSGRNSSINGLFRKQNRSLAASNNARNPSYVHQHKVHQSFQQHPILQSGLDYQNSFHQNQNSSFVNPNNVLTNHMNSHKNFGNQNMKCATRSPKPQPLQPRNKKSLPSQPSEHQLRNLQIETFEQQNELDNDHHLNDQNHAWSQKSYQIAPAALNPQNFSPMSYDTTTQMQKQQQIQMMEQLTQDQLAVSNNIDNSGRHLHTVAQRSSNYNGNSNGNSNTNSMLAQRTMKTDLNNMATSPISEDETNEGEDSKYFMNEHMDAISSVTLDANGIAMQSHCQTENINTNLMNAHNHYTGAMDCSNEDQTLKKSQSILARQSLKKRNAQYQQNQCLKTMQLLKHHQQRNNCKSLNQSLNTVQPRARNDQLQRKPMLPREACQSRSNTNALMMNSNTFSNSKGNSSIKSITSSKVNTPKNNHGVIRRTKKNLLETTLRATSLHQPSHNTLSPDLRPLTLQAHPTPQNPIIYNTIQQPAEPTIIHKQNGQNHVSSLQNVNQNVNQNSHHSHKGGNKYQLSQTSKTKTRPHSVPGKLKQINNQYFAIEQEHFVDDSVSSPHYENSMTQLKDNLKYIGNKIRFYAQMIDHERLIGIVSQSQPPTSAFMKAFRVLCLLLKATVKLCVKDNERFKQIKDAEVFLKWERIQQYLKCDQGSKQIETLKNLDPEQFAKQVDRSTLDYIRASVFSYMKTTLYENDEDDNMEIDLESPRVKNVPLKCYFSLPYFCIVYMQTVDQIKAEEIKMENALFSQTKFSPPNNEKLIKRSSMKKKEELDDEIKLFEGIKINNFGNTNQMQKAKRVTRKGRLLSCGFVPKREVTPQARRFQKQTHPTSQNQQVNYIAVVNRLMKHTISSSNKKVTERMAAASADAGVPRTRTSSLASNHLTSNKGNSTVKKHNPSKSRGSQIKNQTTITPDNKMMASQEKCAYGLVSTAKKLSNADIEMFSSHVKMHQHQSVPSSCCNTSCQKQTTTQTTVPRAQPVPCNPSPQPIIMSNLPHFQPHSQTSQASTSQLVPQLDLQQPAVLEQQQFGYGADIINNNEEIVIQNGAHQQMVMSPSFSNYQNRRSHDTFTFQQHNNLAKAQTMQFNNTHGVVMNQMDIDDQINEEQDQMMQSGLVNMKTHSTDNLMQVTTSAKQSLSHKLLQKSSSNHTTGSSQTQIKIEDFIKQISASQSQGQFPPLISNCFPQQEQHIQNTQMNNFQLNEQNCLQPVTYESSGSYRQHQDDFDEDQQSLSDHFNKPQVIRIQTTEEKLYTVSQRIETPTIDEQTQMFDNKVAMELTGNKESARVSLVKSVKKFGEDLFERHEEVNDKYFDSVEDEDRALQQTERTEIEKSIDENQNYTSEKIESESSEKDEEEMKKSFTLTPGGQGIVSEKSQTPMTEYEQETIKPRDLRKELAQASRGSIGSSLSCDSLGLSIQQNRYAPVTTAGLHIDLVINNNQSPTTMNTLPHIQSVQTTHQTNQGAMTNQINTFTDTTMQHPFQRQMFDLSSHTRTISPSNYQNEHQTRTISPQQRMSQDFCQNEITGGMLDSTTHCLEEAMSAQKLSTSKSNNSISRHSGVNQSKQQHHQHSASSQQKKRIESFKKHINDHYQRSRGTTQPKLAIVHGSSQQMTPDTFDDIM